MKEATCCHNTNPACGLRIAIAAKTAWLKEVPPEGPLGTCSFWSFKAGWHLLCPKSSQAQGTMAQLGTIELGPFCLKLPIGERKNNMEKFRIFQNSGNHKCWSTGRYSHVEEANGILTVFSFDSHLPELEDRLHLPHYTLLLHFSGKPTTSYPVAICTSHYGNEQKSSNYNTLNHTK